jgi:hypothetical protein
MAPTAVLLAILLSNPTDISGVFGSGSKTLAFLQADRKVVAVYRDTAQGCECVWEGRSTLPDRWELYGASRALVWKEGDRLRLADSNRPCCGKVLVDVDLERDPVPFARCRVTSARAFFRTRTAELRRAYVIAGDEVQVAPTEGGLLAARFMGPRARVAGFMSRTDLACSADALPARRRPPALPEGTWMYRMRGVLDGKELLCEGWARLAETRGEDGARCVKWRLDHLDCRGDREVDWLHEGDDVGQVCDRSGWSTAPLPGLGACHVTLSERPRAELALSCTWQCRESSPCSGGAEYSFLAPAAK